MPINGKFSTHLISRVEQCVWQKFVQSISPRRQSGGGVEKFLEARRAGGGMSGEIFGKFSRNLKAPRSGAVEDAKHLPTTCELREASWIAAALRRFPP
jgi:hypothetical protein